MTLELEPQEHELLISLVRGRMQQLLVEIRRTDDSRDFRHYLERELQVWESLGRKLDRERIAK